MGCVDELDQQSRVQHQTPCVHQGNYMTLVAGFLLGLAGSLHCLAMCGPLMAVMPFRTTTTAASMITDRMSYHLARVIVYALLGLVVGFGVELFRIGHVERTAAIVGGALMIAMASMQLILHRSPLPFRAMAKVSRPITAA